MGGRRTRRMAADGSRAAPPRLRTSVVLGLVAVVCLVVSTSPSAAGPKNGKGSAAGPVDKDKVVLEWNEAALEGVRQSTLGPPMVSRALAIIHTCMFVGHDHRAHECGRRGQRCLRRGARLPPS